MTAIATLGSHCALQVLKGAKDEGIKTILVCEKKREKLYKRFPFIDELILVDSFVEVLDQKCQQTLEQNDSVLIPHGTLIAQMSSEQIESIKTPIFGNKWILRWEADREKKEQLMREANLPMPRPVSNPNEISNLVIVKRQGAAGGKGYFMAASEEDYNTKRNELILQGIISKDESLYIQEYAAGVLAYLQFFYSPLKEELEFCFYRDIYSASFIPLFRYLPGHIESASRKPGRSFRKDGTSLRCGGSRLWVQVCRLRGQLLPDAILPPHPGGISLSISRVFKTIG